MRNNTVQYMSSNNIRQIKFCLVVELTSEGSVRLCALWRSLFSQLRPIIIRFAKITSF